MKPIPTEVEPPRILTRPRTQALLDDARDALGAFNEALSNESPTYESIVLFAPDSHHRDTANAVLSLDGHDVPAESLRFRRTQIDGRRVLLAATALGDILKDGRNQFAASRMNDTPQMTWGGIYRHESGPATVIQAAFSMHDTNALPSNDSMDKLWRDYTHDISDASELVRQIVTPSESLGDALELDPPVTPNAYIIRWDIVNSTPLARGQFGALRSYQQHLERSFAEILAREQYVDDFQGDGQNIVFKMNGIDYDDPAAIKLFGTQHIAPALEAMKASHRTIAAYYKDLSPRIRLSVGLGFVEEDHRGRLTGPVFSEITKQPTTNPLKLPRSILEALTDH